MWSQPIALDTVGRVANLAVECDVADSSGQLVRQMLEFGLELHAGDGPFAVTRVC